MLEVLLLLLEHLVLVVQLRLLVELVLALVLEFLLALRDGCLLCCKLLLLLGELFLEGSRGGSQRSWRGGISP